MSKSLEALKSITEYLLWSKRYIDVDVDKGNKEQIELIKQDLECLEQYDETLKTRCGNCYYREGKCCTIMGSPISVETLINCIDTDRVRATNAFHKVLEEKEQLEKENQKLKKAIEILKDKLKVELIENLNIPHEPLSKIKCCLQSDIWLKGITQEEYELLKEVLNNE